jgi:hypothetical protein
MKKIRNVKNLGVPNDDRILLASFPFSHDIEDRRLC